MTVLGISGSLRAGSYNTKLLRAAGELFDAAGAELVVFEGLAGVPPYNEDHDGDQAPAGLGGCARQSPAPTRSSSPHLSTTRRSRAT